MKKKNQRSEATVFRKRLTEKSSVQKKLDGKLESGEISFGDYFHRSLAEKAKLFKAGEGSMAEFLCNEASLKTVMKEAESMALDELEPSDKRAEAHRVKISLENSLTANTIEHAAQLAFIAGMRWMEICWLKSLDSDGRPVSREWEKAEQIFKANRKISTGQLWNRCGKPGNFESFKRTMSRKRKSW